MKTECENLKAKAEHLEQERETWQADLSGLSDKLEKAKFTITETLKEKHEFLKTKEKSDKVYEKMLTDLEILKSKNKTLTLENEKLEAGAKAATKLVKSKEKEIFSLSSRNENMSDNVNRYKS